MDEALKIFRIIATEFKDIPDEDTTDESGNTTYGAKTYLELYSGLISKKRFGKLYGMALAYMTAHKLKMMGFGSQDDNIGSMATALRLSSASEGETSVSFNTALTGTTDADAEYGLTIYGREFLTIKSRVIVGIVSAGEPVIVRGVFDGI